MNRMIIAVASGKGGTGKTTIATNLACMAAMRGEDVQLLDCDVEAPNAHLFLKPHIDRREEITLPVPTLRPAICEACGECARICRFNAIVSLKTKPLLFPELCHGCGGCEKVCPTGAISEGARPLGHVETGYAEKLLYCGGRLRIGEALAPPMIRAVKKRMRPRGTIFIDAPPGTSCPMIETVRHADFVVLVTEPTPFGLNDLNLAVQTMRELGLPCGIVVNRASPGRDMVHCFCASEGIEVLGEIPDDRRIAEAYSSGEMAIRKFEAYGELFNDLLNKVVTAGNASSMRPGRGAANA